MRTILPLIALVAPALALAAPQAGEQTVTLRIAFDDAELASAEGRAALEARIDAKLHKACRLDSTGRGIYGARVDEECVAEARIAALTEVERVAAANAGETRALAAK